MEIRAACDRFVSMIRVSGTYAAGSRTQPRAPSPHNSLPGLSRRSAQGRCRVSLGGEATIDYAKSNVRVLAHMGGGGLWHQEGIRLNIISFQYLVAARVRYYDIVPTAGKRESQHLINYYGSQIPIIRRWDDAGGGWT